MNKLQTRGCWLKRLAVAVLLLSFVCNQVMAQMGTTMTTTSGNTGLRPMDQTQLRGQARSVSSKATTNSTGTTTTSDSTTDADADSETGADGSATDSDGSSALSALAYACSCGQLRRVSLMGASDYCLLPSAAVGNKCGNVVLGEKGECPRTGAQPCQDTGHVLTNDSMCAYDEHDDTFKCVASKEDLLLQTRGTGRKRNKRKKKLTGSGADGLNGGENGVYGATSGDSSPRLVHANIARGLSVVVAFVVGLAVVI